MRGFIVELASLVALIAAIWAGTHLSERIATVIGLDTGNAALAFLVTFMLVLMGVHLLGRSLTAVVDIAQLSLPNKVAGLFFSALRSVFILSVILNMLMGYSGGAIPPAEARAGSMLMAPVQAVAPMLVPALEGTKWVRRAVEEVKQGVDQVVGE
jgi:membrane protein required for colicin V production